MFFTRINNLFDSPGILTSSVHNTMQRIKNTSVYNQCIALLYISFTVVKTSRNTQTYTISIGTIYGSVYIGQNTGEYSVSNCITTYTECILYLYCWCISGEVFQMIIIQNLQSMTTIRVKEQ